MLVDLQGYGDDVNPLDDDGLVIVGQEQVAAAAGAGVEEVVGGLGSEQLGREGDPLVRGMSRLPAGLAPRWPGGGCGSGGFTMSEEGGLDEVEESLRAAASCFCNWTTMDRRASSSARRVSTSARNRRQFAHGGVVSVIMEAESILPSAGIQHCERARNQAFPSTTSPVVSDPWEGEPLPSHYSMPARREARPPEWDEITCAVYQSLD